MGKMARKFAYAITKKALYSSEEGCHNDRFTLTRCFYCDASNYSGKLTHKEDCPYLAAEKYLSK